MSQTIRSLEERLGVRLFNRTTRSVALTEAGERLLAEIQPIIAGLDHALESVNLFRDQPIGTLRLAVSRPSAMRRLAPLIQPFLTEYPAIRLEVVVDDTANDIVSGRFDAGIRVGQRVERDMTVLRLADDFRFQCFSSLLPPISRAIRRRPTRAIFTPTIASATASPGTAPSCPGRSARAGSKRRSRSTAH